MEQVNGGTLVVNRGSSDTSSSAASSERDLNLVEGLSAASKLARANLDSLVRLNPTSSSSSAPSSSSHPAAVESGDKATICPVYIRLQPALAPMPWYEPTAAIAASAAEQQEGKEEAQVQDDKFLFFLLVLVDPSNSLRHETLTQAIPAGWLDIPFEENEWVEQEMVDVIRKGVEILGQEYISGRQSGRSKRSSGVATPHLQQPSEFSQGDDEGGEHAGQSS
jgi:hypothetical protein